MRTTTTIAAALLAAAPPAFAAQIVAVDTNIEGRLTPAAPVQAWALRLLRGKGYALVGTSGWCSSYAVRGPDGKVLARTSTPADPDSSDVTAGEFLAPVTGIYRMEARGTPCWTGLPWAIYDAGVYRDCPGSVRSPCRLPIGGTWTGRTLTDDDADWVGVALRVGQSYTFTGTASSTLVLRDPGGNVAASADPPATTGIDTTPAPAVIRNFVPRRTGTWFLTVEDNAAATFTLKASQP